MTPAEFRLAVLREPGVVYAGPLDDLCVGCASSEAARRLVGRVPPEVPVFVLEGVSAEPVVKCTALVKHRGVQRYEDVKRATTKGASR